MRPDAAITPIAHAALASPRRLCVIDALRHGPGPSEPRRRRRRREGAGQDGVAAVQHFIPDLEHITRACGDKLASVKPLVEAALGVARGTPDPA